MSDVITFTATGTFEAMRAAEAWLDARGFSVGLMQGAEPRGIRHGDCDISKWRNLGPTDKLKMHATMTGDQRNGPVHLRLCPSATAEAVAAWGRVLAAA